MGRRRRLGRTRDGQRLDLDERTLRVNASHGRREPDAADDAQDAEFDALDGDAQDAELEDGADTDEALEDGADLGDDADMDVAVAERSRSAARRGSRRASESVSSGLEEVDAGASGEAMEGLTLRERRMAAQLAETQRRMAEMHYRLYETSVDRVLAGWDRQTFQFSVIESRVRNPRGDMSGGRGGATVRRQGMIGLSRAAREAIREVMLSETVFRLPDGEREQIWRAFELALAGAVDLSARGGSFDQEERKTIRRGGPALSGPATEAALQEAAESLALGEYGKPLSRLTHEELVQVQLHAAEQTGYR